MYDYNFRVEEEVLGVPVVLKILKIKERPLSDYQMTNEMIRLLFVFFQI